jgi:hypothetical protein
MAESCFSPALAAAGIFSAQPVTLPPRPFGNAPRPRTPSASHSAPGHSQHMERDEYLHEIRTRLEEEQQPAGIPVAEVEAMLAAQAQILEEKYASPERKPSPRDNPADVPTKPTVTLDVLTKALAKPPTKEGSFITDKAASLIKSTLEPDDRNGFMLRVVTQSKRADTTVGDLVKNAPKNKNELNEYVEGLSETERVTNLRLADTIMECLVESSPYVTLLVKATQTSPDLSTSGVHIFAWIHEQGEEDDPEEAKERFDATHFFQVGADTAVNKVNGAKLIEAAHALPPQYLAIKHAILSLILKKIPPECKDEQWAERLRVDFRLATKNGISGEAPWTEVTLIGHIASFLENKAVPSPAIANKGVGPEPRKFTRALCCGKEGKEGDHQPWDCPYKCTTCDTHLCPKTFGGVCLKDMAERPTAETLQNGLGRPVSTKDRPRTHLIEKAADIFDKHRLAKGRPSTIPTAAVALQTQQTETELEQPQGQQIYVNLVD